jgi:hypothetical protein
MEGKILNAGPPRKDAEDEEVNRTWVLRQAARK